ncbi:MAG TPA: hypothetical protein O0Y08_05775, partial [Methanocorpusculum sp.]|nr:hypothetical protein [Methanocorpusculum sp.]
MKVNKKGIFAAAAVLLLAAALFVGAGAAEATPVTTEDGLKTAVGTADFNIVLQNDITLHGVLVIDKPGTIDGATHSIKFVEGPAKSYSAQDGVIRVALADSTQKVTLKNLGIIGPLTDGTGAAPEWKSNAVPLKAFGG